MNDSLPRHAKCKQPIKSKDSIFEKPRIKLSPKVFRKPKFSRNYKDGLRFRNPGEKFDLIKTEQINVINIRRRRSLLNSFKSKGDVSPSDLSPSQNMLPISLNNASILDTRSKNDVFPLLTSETQESSNRCTRYIRRNKADETSFPEVKHPLSDDVTKGMCKCCRSSAYQGELEVPNHIQLLKADLDASGALRLNPKVTRRKVKKNQSVRQKDRITNGT